MTQWTACDHICRTWWGARPQFAEFCPAKPQIAGPVRAQKTSIQAHQTTVRHQSADKNDKKTPRLRIVSNSSLTWTYRSIDDSSNGLRFSGGKEKWEHLSFISRSMHKKAPADQARATWYKRVESLGVDNTSVSKTNFIGSRCRCTLGLCILLAAISQGHERLLRKTGPRSVTWESAPHRWGCEVNVIGR